MALESCSPVMQIYKSEGADLTLEPGVLTLWASASGYVEQSLYTALCWC